LGWGGAVKEIKEEETEQRNTKMEGDQKTDQLREGEPDTLQRQLFQTKFIMQL